MQDRPFTRQPIYDEANIPDVRCDRINLAEKLTIG